MNQQILERARKLKAMAERGTLHEAEIAAAKLAALMFEHNITAGMLEEHEAEFTEDARTHARRGGVNWRRVLYQELARANFCQTVLSADGEVHHIYGSRANIDFVDWLYEFLEPQISRLSEIGWAEEREMYRRMATPKYAQMTATRWKNSFKHGAVAGIIKRLREQRESLTSQDARTSALVVAHDARLSRFMRENVGRTTSTRVTYAAGDPYESGQAASRDLSLNRPVPATPHGARALGRG